MNKEDKNTIFQLANILNFKPQIKEQHIHIGNRSAEVQQETKADEEKRNKLIATNTVIRTQSKSGKQTIDLLKLYKYIDRHFASEIEHKYEWYALRRFLEKYNLLRECDNEKFAK